ncbi:transmembrane protein, putative [Medicago truncatula]|uniref:Transmembrane protein, putative n=1 Tax=Medicago truncatula TaxID=3880 RepID=A0A072VGS9_MEDTR|nr:transmembrane protein, putative [Medicago truncatula]
MNMFNLLSRVEGRGKNGRQVVVVTLFILKWQLEWMGMRVWLLNGPSVSFLVGFCCYNDKLITYIIMGLGKWVKRKEVQKLVKDH